MSLPLPLAGSVRDRDMGRLVLPGGALGPGLKHLLGAGFQIDGASLIRAGAT